MQPQLASRFARNRRELVSGAPLTEEQLRRVVPSIFADGAYASRSARYTYIPTIDILRDHGFEPYTAAQTRVRDDSHRDYTKHLLRLRHRVHRDGDTANEVILLNSHSP